MNKKHRNMKYIWQDFYDRLPSKTTRLKRDDIMRAGDVLVYRSGSEMIIDGWAGSPARELSGWDTIIRCVERRDEA